MGLAGVGWNALSSTLRPLSSFKRNFWCRHREVSSGGMNVLICWHVVWLCISCQLYTSRAHFVLSFMLADLCVSCGKPRLAKRASKHEITTKTFYSAYCCCYDSCFSVWLFLYIYICMYVCSYVSKYVCVYVCMYVRTYVCMCLCMHVLCKYICIYISST